MQKSEMAWLLIMTKDQMIWDLSQLVESTDPTSVQKKLQLMVAEGEKIRDKYHGKIMALDAIGLLELLDAKDSFTLRFDGVTKYCRLMYDADSTSDVAKQFKDAERRASMRVGQTLAFIDIEVGKLLAEKPSLVSDQVLSEYKHYLERLLRRVPHMLSETEERLIIAKDKNGINAWQMLQSHWLSTRSFDMEIEGETKRLPWGKMVGLFESPNRDLRKQSHQIAYENLGKDEIIWASAIRAVCEDHLQMCDLRKWSTPMTQSLIADDVDQQIIDSLINAIRKNVGLYQRYLRLKAKLMDLDKLANYDLLAPLPNAPKIDYTWEDAREEAVSAYRGFDEEIGRWADEMFEKRHIDGEVRNGKTSGAFCEPWLTGKSAYILQSFNGKIGDVYTQVHELGHAVHAYLNSRAQKPSNLEIGNCVAETGSTFGELLLTDRLLFKAKTKEERQAILVHILDEFGVAAFLVSARFFLEQSIYDAMKRGEFLDGEGIARLWNESRLRIFGDAVDWLEVMKWQWTPTSHYYLANFRFYNYPYVFAQLFVFALYKIYKEQGVNFVPRLKKLLAAGSSKSPKELAAELGFDITEEAFWEKGMKQAEELVDMLERTL
jgi:oligoendopeptidase F